MIIFVCRCYTMLAVLMSRVFSSCPIHGWLWCILWFAIRCDNISCLFIILLLYCLVKHATTNTLVLFFPDCYSLCRWIVYSSNNLYIVKYACAAKGIMRDILEKLFVLMYFLVFDLIYSIIQSILSQIDQVMNIFVKRIFSNWQHQIKLIRHFLL